MSRKQSKRARFYALSRGVRHFVRDVKEGNVRYTAPGESLIWLGAAPCAMLAMTPERARLIQVAVFIWAVRLDENPTLAEAAEHIRHSLTEVREALRVAPPMNGAVLEIRADGRIDAYYCDPTEG